MLSLYVPILVLGFSTWLPSSRSSRSGWGPLPARSAGTARNCDAYECGIEPTQQSSGSRFPVKYYLTAMLFILFDIEIVFLYPWAVACMTTSVPSGSSRWCCPSSPFWSRTPTCGGAAVWSGTSRWVSKKSCRAGSCSPRSRRWLLRAQEFRLASTTFGLALPRDRADADRRAAARLRPLRDGARLQHAAPGRPDDRGLAGSARRWPWCCGRSTTRWPTRNGSSRPACASSGGMFNNYAIVQGVDHVVPVDIYLSRGLSALAGDAAARDREAARQDPEHEAGREP